MRDKRSYLSHWSALAFWTIPEGEHFFADELRGAAQVDHYTVFSRRHYYRKKGQCTHTCILDVPESAKRIVHGRRVVSVEYAFLQVAYDLDIQRLIFLAMLLTSNFSGEPDGQLTTLGKLREFVRIMAKHRGRRKATRALKYCAEDSRSTLEILTYMHLALPPLLGGAGLRGAIFNHKIPLTSAEKHRIQRRHLFADIYYPTSRVIIEYDSDLYHRAPQKQKLDLARAAILHDKGYKVCTVRKKQIYDLMHWRHVVREAARGMKARIRIQTKKFLGAFRDLRCFMPRAEIAPYTHRDAPADLAAFLEYLPVKVP